MKTKYRLLTEFIGLICFLTITAIAQAESLEVVLTDAQGQPVKDAVVALIPDSAIDYNKMPTAIMDQRDKMFDPRVLAIRVNTQVRFPNSDDVRHHVYSFSPAKKFELRLYHGLTAEPIVFDKVGEVVLGCNIHDSMIGYIYVLNTEYFAKSDTNGSLVISNIPAGDYQLELHHPDLSDDYPVEKIQVTSGSTPKKILILKNLAVPSAGVGEFDNLF